MPVQRWSAQIRATAERLAVSEDLGPAGVAERLKTETGETVPLATVSRWLALMPARATRPDVPTTGALADQALALVSSELRRLERQSRPDLDRLAKVAQILKTIDGLRQGPKVKPRSLADLSEAQSAHEAEAVRLAA